MSRLDNLLQRWRESPENSDNWDLERWKIEHVRVLRLGYVCLLLFGLLASFGYFINPYIISSYGGFIFCMLFMGSMLLLIDYYYVRTIRRLEEPEVAE